jgi:hypothetical protein
MNAGENGNGKRTTSAEAAEAAETEAKCTELAEALGRLQTKYRLFTLRISFEVMAAMVFYLRMALEHTSDTYYCWKVVRELVEKIVATIEAAGEPRAAELLRRGDDPSCDVEVRTCRACGCTDDDCGQCVEAQGHPCHWVEADLCSRCASSEVNQAGDAGGKDG